MQQTRFDMRDFGEPAAPVCEAQVHAPRPAPSRAARRSSGRAAAVPGERTTRLALSPDEAATALGISRDFFDKHVMPELRVVRRGRRRLVPVRELERWLDQEGARLLDHR